MGYKVNLVYFWLSSPVIAVNRVAKRVAKGGHHIPSDVIERRYYRGIHNLHSLYMPVCDEWVIIDNMDLKPDIMDQSLPVISEVSFADKVMFGLKIALRKMAKEAALHDERLVIGYKDGTFKSVPAKELLETLPK